MAHKVAALKGPLQCAFIREYFIADKTPFSVTFALQERWVVRLLDSWWLSDLPRPCVSAVGVRPEMAGARQDRRCWPTPEVRAFGR